SDTAVEDVKGIPAGGAVVYEETLGLDRVRGDVVFYPVPFQKIVKEVCPDPKLRKLVVNMVYVGVVAHLLGIDVEEIRKALQKAYRVDPATQKATFAIVQAEDELAALGMVIGAGWAGARAMTSTSGPGVSLMGEFIGLAYYSEIPGVIFDIQRTGPSTGLPT